MFYKELGYANESFELVMQVCNMMLGKFNQHKLSLYHARR
jgi:hypothetical protein